MRNLNWIHLSVCKVKVTLFQIKHDVGQNYKFLQIPNYHVATYNIWDNFYEFGHCFRNDFTITASEHGGL